MSIITELYKEKVLGNGLRNQSESNYDLMEFATEVYRLFVKDELELEEKARQLEEDVYWFGLMLDEKSKENMSERLLKYTKSRNLNVK